MIRLLFVGDVVGRSGRAALLEQVPLLRARWALDFVTVNGENAAGGFGLTEAIFEEFLAAGVDAVTLGNHAFAQRETVTFIERQPRLIRPVNFPPGTPGQGATVVESAKGARLLIVNVMGRIFMDPLDDPFAAVKRELGLCPLGEKCDASVIDVHAEASSEKWAIGHFADGKASLIVGTHTHVPSADHRILPGGTGFITDMGMTGDYDSVIGMEKEEPLRRFTGAIPSGRFEPAQGPATLCGVAAEIGPDGRTKALSPVRIGGLLSPAAPDFWS
jgi:2',3'-cyclic-nucleotide 2'-phosphodiesterase